MSLWIADPESFRLDLGQQVVMELFSDLNVAGSPATVGERFFWWECGAFRQWVWADAGYREDGCEIYRIHAITDLVREVRRETGLYQVLNEVAARAALSAYNSDEEQRRVSLQCVVCVLDQNQNSARALLRLAARLQLAEASQVADQLAGLLEGTAPAVQPDSHSTPPPVRGIEEELAAASARSPWGPTEFLATRDSLNSGNCLSTTDECALVAEFPFGSRRTSLLEMFLVIHPLFGNGLLARLHLPMDDGSYAREVNLLNSLEAASRARTHLLGSWCFERGRGTVCFTSFYPNGAYRRGLLADLCLGMANRADWVAQELEVPGPPADVCEVVRGRLALFAGSKELGTKLV